MPHAVTRCGTISTQMGPKPRPGRSPPFRMDPGRRVRVAVLMSLAQVLCPLALLREIRPCDV